MKLKLAIDPDIVALMAAEVEAGERAVTAGMREAGTGLKSAWRGQITGAGLGTRLANSIRSASFPKSSESLNAAALVWSNAPVIIGAPGDDAHQNGRTTVGDVDRVPADIRIGEERADGGGEGIHQNAPFRRTRPIRSVAPPATASVAKPIRVLAEAVVVQFFAVLSQ